MTKVITFADGFTSTTAPEGAGATQEDYLISNNTSGGAVLTLDSSTCKTAFIDYSLIRSDSLGTFVKAGSMIASYDGAWLLTEGNYQGDDMTDGTASTIFSINSVTGAITYISGNMLGTGYVGTFKISITRIL